MEQHRSTASPYSPDLAPCVYWLFPTFNKAIRGWHFHSNDEVVNAATKSSMQHAPFLTPYLKKTLRRWSTSSGQRKWRGVWGSEASTSRKRPPAGSYSKRDVSNVWNKSFPSKIFFTLICKGIPNSVYANSYIYFRQVIKRWGACAHSTHIELL